MDRACLLVIVMGCALGVGVYLESIDPLGLKVVTKFGTYSKADEATYQRVKQIKDKLGVE